ncbi:hypothetical protein VTJ04DRAFT_6657 [Mycothermus thermophilus]|uniref:uncharacterized protein n=1 Tax=Humicola insolens TaxID=85995 RepID=UPI0037420498
MDQGPHHRQGQAKHDTLLTAPQLLHLSILNTATPPAQHCYSRPFIPLTTTTTIPPRDELPRLSPDTLFFLDF